MLFSELPEDFKFLDVDGIPVVDLPSGSALAFEAGKGLDSPSRPWLQADEGYADDEAPDYANAAAALARSEASSTRP